MGLYSLAPRLWKGLLTMQLSEMACRNAKAKEQLYKIFDGGGLYLEVTPQGKRNWRLKYRYLGTEKRISFGPYPEISLLEAREKREAAKKDLRQGVDPSELKKEIERQQKYNGSQTLELVAREWHKEYYDRWSKKHAEDILHRLEMDVFKILGKMQINKIRAPHIFACVKKIEDRGAQEMARRTLQYIGQIFRYATVTGRIERDLTTDLKGSLKKQKKGHFASIKVDELPAFVKKLKSNDARLFKQTIHAINLLMLTFVRTSELIEAPWTEFDLEKAVWNIPGDRMKMGHPHIVPLSKQAISILNQLKQENGHRHFILPSVIQPQKCMSNNTILKALERMDYKGKMTGHGFRALAMGAIKERLGYRHEVVDRQLAHRPQSKVDRAYDRAEFLNDRVKMMQEWADYIDGLTTF